MRVRFKACPRCKGDVALNRDVYGPYWDCLACGWHWDMSQGTPRMRRAVG